MKHILSFEHENAPYQVMQLETLDKVQLWYFTFEGRWVIGHGKNIPQGMDAFDVAEAMREFIQGDITLAEYNSVLPY